MNDNTQHFSPAYALRREYSILSSTGAEVAVVVAESSMDALRRAGLTDRADVWAVPRSARAATTLAPSAIPAALPAYVAPVQQNVVVSNDRKRKVPHVLHFVLTVLTAGLWGIVWIIDSLANGRNS